MIFKILGWMAETVLVVVSAFSLALLLAWATGNLTYTITIVGDSNTTYSNMKEGTYVNKK